MICTRDRPRSLRGCLAALVNQACRPVEIIVVDNADRGESTAESAMCCPGWMRRVVEPHVGVAAARNRGLVEASQPLIAFIDDDCRPRPDWLQTICTAFEGPPELGCCTGGLPPLRPETLAQQLMEVRGGFLRSELRLEFTGASARAVQAWRYGSGANMSFRRKVVLQGGGFDAALRSGEDLDVFFRVLRSGWRLRYEPEAVVYHRHLMQTRLFSWGWAYGAFLMKTARDDRRFGRPALRELAGTIGYHVKRFRAEPHTGRYPPRLVAAELIGQICRGPAYLWCTRARRNLFRTPGVYD